MNNTEITSFTPEQVRDLKIILENVLADALGNAKEKPSKSPSMSIEEVADETGLSISTVRRYMRDPSKGFPDWSKPGGKYIFRRKDIEKWNESNKRNFFKRKK